MKNLPRITALFLLIAVLASSFVLSAHAAKLTDAEYADLFKRASGPPVEGITAELENAFIADPLGFIKALSKENYGTMYSTIRNGMGGVDWANDPNRTEHRDALLSIAGAGNLTQPQRRVVKWLLIYTDLAKDYEIFTDEIDYPELFSHVLFSNEMIFSNVLEEIVSALDRNPKKFLEALALENEDIRDKAIFELASAHYYAYYDYAMLNYATIGDAMNACNLAEVELNAAFWAQVDKFENPPSTQPSTISRPPVVTSPQKPNLYISNPTDRIYYEYDMITFSVHLVGDSDATLYIALPDGTQQAYAVSDDDVLNLSFPQKGNYSAWIVEKFSVNIPLQSDVRSFRIYSKTVDPLPTLTPPSTAPEPIPEEKPLNIPTPWIIIGLVAVIFGVQAVAFVLYRKKSTPAEEDFDE